MSIKLELLNSDAVKNLIGKRMEKGLQPALEKAKELVEAKFQTNPASWVPLKAATIQQRLRLHYGAGPMLYRTGRLQGQAVQELAVDSPTEGHISTNDPIAKIQNKTRPIYQFSEDEKKLIFEAFRAGIKG